jgi:hypothetical protein
MNMRQAILATILFRLLACSVSRLGQPGKNVTLPPLRSRRVLISVHRTCHQFNTTISSYSITEMYSIRGMFVAF